MDNHIISEVKGRAGLLTLNRARALNALSLAMIRDLTASLLSWRDDPSIAVVAMRGMGKPASPGGAEQAFGAFCAGGDIRFFHQAALAGNPELEDFFTEEYRLNHLIHGYPKPVVAFMDGIVMGGGMGLAQGASARIVTARTKMAMPETHIGLFPDVGGGYFLSRCAGHLGEYLALTGHVIDGPQAVAAGLADQAVPVERLGHLWDALADYGSSEADTEFGDPGADVLPTSSGNGAAPATAMLDPLDQARIDRYFGLSSISAMLQALEADAPSDDWARTTAAALRKRSPLMLHVTLEQIRKARGMHLADDLRMERDMVYQCFHQRPGTSSETVEGIRALAVDKDYKPKWSPARIEDVKPGMADAFFVSPWAAEAHPLRQL
jgi:enoyl-CoA hydratase/carnithine racemase